MIPKVQIVIEKWSAPKDMKGNPKEQIDNRYNVWAEVVKTGGYRTDDRGQTSLVKNKLFKVRFRPDWNINSSWKVVYDGKRYAIKEIQKINEKRFNWLINGEG